MAGSHKRDTAASRSISRGRRGGRGGDKGGKGSRKRRRRDKGGRARPGSFFTPRSRPVALPSTDTRAKLQSVARGAPARHSSAQPGAAQPRAAQPHTARPRAAQPHTARPPSCRAAASRATNIQRDDHSTRPGLGNCCWQSVEPGTPVFEGSPAPQSAVAPHGSILCACALPDNNCGQSQTVCYRSLFAKRKRAALGSI